MWPFLQRALEAGVERERLSGHSYRCVCISETFHLFKISNPSFEARFYFHLHHPRNVFILQLLHGSGVQVNPAGRSLLWTLSKASKLWRIFLSDMLASRDELPAWRPSPSDTCVCWVSGWRVRGKPWPTIKHCQTQTTFNPVSLQTRSTPPSGSSQQMSWSEQSNQEERSSF